MKAFGRWLFLALLCLLPMSAKGQTRVNISGTVVDPDGVPYAGATVQSTLISPGGPSPSLTPCNNPQAGCPLAAPWPATTAGPDGSFHFTLYANSSILPAGTQWQFTVAQPGINSPWGTNGQTITYQATINSDTDLSAPLKAAAKLLTVPFCNPLLTGQAGCGGTGTGCIVTGLLNTWVLSIHPNTTCYGSADWTWDDTNTNMQAGDGSNTVAPGANETFIFGGGNALNASTDNFIFGENNDFSDASGLGFGSNAAVGLNNGFVQNGTTVLGDIFMFGDGNTAATLSGSAGTLDNVTLLGQSNRATFHQGVDGESADILLGGYHNFITSTNPFGMFDIHVVGDQNTLEDDLGETAEADIFGEQNDIDGAFSTSGIFGFQNTIHTASAAGSGDYTMAIGAYNSITNAAPTTFASIFGNSDTLANCDNCMILGNDVSLITSNMIALGLSPSAEIKITPGHVSFGGAGTSASLPLCTDGSNFISTTGCPSGLPASPTVNGSYPCGYTVTASAAVPVTCPEAGLGGNTISGATSGYTMLFSNNLQVVNHDAAASAAVTLTLPTPTDLTNPAFGSSYENDSAFTDAITPCTIGVGCAATWTINGLASQPTPAHFAPRLKVDPFNATNWLAPLFPFALHGVMNGVAYSALYPGATLDVRVNACITDAETGAHGAYSHICSSVGEAVTQSYPAQITIGDVSEDEVTWFLPAVCRWTETISDGTSSAIFQYGQTKIRGAGANNNCEIIAGGTSSGTYALYTNNGNDYYQASGFILRNGGIQMASGFTMYVPGAFDNSVYASIVVNDYSTGDTAAVRWGNAGSNGPCCGTVARDITIYDNNTGPADLDVEGGQGSVFENLSAGHPKAGQPNILLNNTTNDSNVVAFTGLTYLEGNSTDTSTALIQQTGQGNYHFDTLFPKPEAGSPSTAVAMTIAASYSPIVTIDSIASADNGHWTYPTTLISDSSNNCPVALRPCLTPSGLRGNLGHFSNTTDYSGNQLIYGNLTVNGTCTGCGTPSGGTGVMAGGQPLATPSATGFGSLSGKLAEVVSPGTAVFSIAPKAMSVVGIFVNVSAAEGAAATRSFTFSSCTPTAGTCTPTASAVTCTIPNNGTSCFDTSHTASVAAGDLILYKDVQTGTGTSQVASVSIAFN